MTGNALAQVDVNALGAWKCWREHAPGRWWRFEPPTKDLETQETVGQDSIICTVLHIPVLHMTRFGVDNS